MSHLMELVLFYILCFGLVNIKGWRAAVGVWQVSVWMDETLTLKLLLCCVYNNYGSILCELFF